MLIDRIMNDYYYYRLRRNIKRKFIAKSKELKKNQIDFQHQVKSFSFLNALNKDLKEQMQALSSETN